MYLNTARLNFIQNLKKESYVNKIRDSCVNCDNLLEGNTGKVHGVKVGNSYTCDSFEMKAALKSEQNCERCFRFEASDCANPQKTAPGMSCNQWAPQTAMA